MEETTKRQRGAQPNNTNALKHGYYASKLPVNQSEELRAHHFDGLQEEKGIIRFFLSRVLMLGAESSDLQQNIDFLRAVSLAVSTLTRIVRVEKYAGYLDLSEGNRELEERICELAHRFNLEDEAIDRYRRDHPGAVVDPYLPVRYYAPAYDPDNTVETGPENDRPAQSRPDYFQFDAFKHPDDL